MYSELLPFISVIIPVFNGAMYLPKCLDSILAQTYPAYEAILINDGSTDQTASVCNEYARKDGRIHYIEQENHGLAATRNIGLQASKGAYISFIDADDWVKPTYLAYLYQLIRTSSCGISACNHVIYRGTKPVPRFPVSDNQVILTPREVFSNILYDQYPDVSACGKLYVKKVLDEIRYPEGRLFEDSFRIAEIVLAGGGVVYGSKPQYFYRIQRNSLSRGPFNKSKMDYLSAINHMTEVIAANYKGLDAGIARRRMHALLSVRRFLVGCSESETEIRNDLDRQIRLDSKRVLRDRRAPLRDKIGILSAKAGPGIFDMVWTVYEGIRRR